MDRKQPDFAISGQKRKRLCHTWTENIQTFPYRGRKQLEFVTSAQNTT
jgi:hypothetical protein